MLVSAGASKVEETTLPASDPPGNLVRDPRFQLHWIRPEPPDFWSRASKDGVTSWESEPLPVRSGQRYRFVVRWKPGVASALDGAGISDGRDVGSAAVTLDGEPVAFTEPFWFAVAAFRPDIEIVDR